MKLHCLKLLIAITCLCLAQTAIAQDQKLKMHAMSIGPGIASSASATAKSGVGLNFDISAIVNTHIISFHFNTGLQLNSGGPDEDFHEFNFTYGRKWSLAQNLILEGHAGVGLFTYNRDEKFIPFFINSPQSTIGFPIRAKLLLYPFKKFGIGLNPNLNFNSLSSAYSVNLLFQYNFD